MIPGLLCVSKVSSSCIGKLMKDVFHLTVYLYVTTMALALALHGDGLM